MNQITIVGLGPVSVSLGMALKNSSMHNTQIVGTDTNTNTLKRVRDMGVFDLITGNTSQAVEGAELVVVDTPLDDIRGFLETVGPDIQPGTVITETGTAKIQVFEWAKKYLPEGVDLIGSRPLPRIQVAKLDDATSKVFEDSTYCIITPETASGKSIQMVANMAEAIGTKPLFMDPHEYDSYVAAVTHLPLVAASAYVKTATDRETWAREMHLLASNEFYDISRLSAYDPQDVAAACQATGPALVYWIDALIDQLNTFKGLLNTSDAPNSESNQEPSLVDAFIDAWEQRTRWRIGAVTENSDEPKPPSATESMTRMFVGGKAAKRLSNTGKRTKHLAPWKYHDRK